MRKHQPCDGCESLKQLAAEIDDEPGTYHVETCFTCGKSRIVPAPKLHQYIGFQAHEILDRIRIAIGKARGRQ
jgi:hypothetical protein